MKLHPLPCFIILVALVSCGPDKKESLHDTFGRINAEVLHNSKAYNTLGEATETIGHRLTGSENGHKAEEYVFRKFKEYGFEDVAFQEFEVKAWSRGSLDVKLDGEKIPAVTLAHSPVAANVTAEVADAGSGLEKDYEKNPDIVKGKIALIYIGLLPGLEKEHNLHRSEKTSIAFQHGAKGVMIYNTVANGVMFTGTASVTGQLISIPAICIGKETGMELREKLKTKKIIASIEMTNHSEPIRARNVIATIRGSELPDEKIIIGGHLDSWDLATGAIDNGIGSFAVLDIARAFIANHLVPKRTVQFVLFMGEEQGLLGSRFMTAQAVNDKSIQHIKYMMNLDMAGNPIGISASNKLDDTVFFKNLGKEISDIDTLFKNKQKRGSSLHSDHEPFMLEGIPVLGVVSNLKESIYDGYHSSLDMFNLVDQQSIINTARFGTMILYGLANADKLPAHTLTSNETKQFMIDNGLKEALVIGGDWRWEQ
jgi:carboxypeptidase Q